MAQPGPTPSDRPAAGPDPAPPRPAAPGPHRVTDESLVELFNGLRDELVSTLLYLLGNPDDAQDAAQEAFLKCWRTRAGLPDVQNLRAWIFRVGLNAAKDMQRSAWHRKAKPLLGEDTMLVDRAVDPGQAVADQDDLNRLRRALVDLRTEEKEVFLLRQNGGLTYEQIAEIRSAPVGTVKTQMRSALIKLRRVLNPEPSLSDEQ